MFGTLTANNEVLHQRHASVETTLGLAFVGGGRRAVLKGVLREHKSTYCVVGVQKHRPGLRMFVLAWVERVCRLASFAFALTLGQTCLVGLVKLTVVFVKDCGQVGVAVLKK